MRRDRTRSAVSWLPPLFAGLATVTLATCGLEPDWEVRRGTIEFYGDPVVVDVPDTITLGTPAMVTVRTYGGGCHRKGFTEVSVDGLTAAIDPYDSLWVGGGGCPDILLHFEHAVSVELAEPGTATIRVVGRTLPADTVLVAVRSVVVR
ncbi:MAG: hypothetical protein ACE5PT_06285 [Gemmatimonadales bacterium]